MTKNESNVAQAGFRTNYSSLRKQIDKGIPRDIIDRNVALVGRLSKENEEIAPADEEVSPIGRIIPDPKYPKRGHN